MSNINKELYNKLIHIIHYTISMLVHIVLQNAKVLYLNLYRHCIKG